MPQSHKHTSIALRPYPYPYVAMLAICSDLDETPNQTIYRAISDYLNTDRETSLGKGLNIEVGNTLYFDMPPSQYAYWNTNDEGRAIARALIASGHIDCFHSYGDLATTREHAGRALDELAKYDLRIECWVDHGRAINNLGADNMGGEGDLPGSLAYHADLTLASGVKYIWIGRVSSFFGQNVPKRYHQLLDSAHPLPSARTMTKELAKGALARLGNPKYAMHAGNRLMRPYALRDGQPAIEFIRSDPYWGGISICDQGRRLGETLTERALERLIRNGGATILYTHLGKIDSIDNPWPASTKLALQHLARHHHEGRILVTTTRRLLGYLHARGNLDWCVSQDGDATVIDILSNQSRDDLQGITFTCEDASKTRLRINGVFFDEGQIEASIQNERQYLSIPWRRLDYPIWDRA